MLSPGVVEISAGRIVALRRARGAVPDRVLLPGLVNAHVHLQLPPLRQAPRDFVPWLRAVIAARAGIPARELVATAASGLAQLLGDGVTAVGEIDSSGLSPQALRQVPLAGRCYQEVLGFALGPAAARTLVRQRMQAGTRHCPAGLSPHAPYSVSPALLRRVQATGLPLAVHLAEDRAELALLAAGTGPLATLLRELGKLPADFVPPRLTPTAWLARAGALGGRTQLVHAQHLAPREAEQIAAAGAAIVVCPGTIEHFRRAPPPVPAWLQLGIPVGLGTDSLASNTGLSLRREMARARGLWPELSPEQVLAMATRHGGRALARPGLGRLRVGGRADLLALTLEPGEGLGAALDRFTAGADRTVSVWLRGRAVEAHGGQS